MIDDDWWWLMMIDDWRWWLMIIDDNWWWLMMIDDEWLINDDWLILSDIDSILKLFSLIVSQIVLFCFVLFFCFPHVLSFSVLSPARTQHTRAHTNTHTHTHARNAHQDCDSLVAKVKWVDLRLNGAKGGRGQWRNKKAMPCDKLFAAIFIAASWSAFSMFLCPVWTARPAHAMHITPQCQMPLTYTSPGGGIKTRGFGRLHDLENLMALFCTMQSLPSDLSCMWIQSKFNISTHAHALSN